MPRCQENQAIEPEITKFTISAVVTKPTPASSIWSVTIIERNAIFIIRATRVARDSTTPIAVAYDGCQSIKPKHARITR